MMLYRYYLSRPHTQNKTKLIQPQKMGKNLKITKVKKSALKVAKLQKGPNAIKKPKKPKKVLEEKSQELMTQLNINIGDMLQKELEKLNLAAAKIEEERKRKKEVELKNYLSTYGKDHDKKLIENVAKAVAKPEVLSRGQRKRLAQKEKVARRKLLAQQADKAKGRIQVDLKPFKFQKPKDESKNPSAIETSIAQKKQEEEKMIIGVQKKAIKKNKKKRKSKLAKSSIKEFLFLCITKMQGRRYGEIQANHGNPTVCAKSCRCYEGACGKHYAAGREEGETKANGQIRTFSQR
eukprot:TRINITY_DN88651_c0_g1_i1.p1 TRINITY_DN88651_c0_g1~~TRINITY_DN88651_c0_g1_i1.p1  ORF type:complete len:293 (+),score=48.44 TRINITY_DN88651_c0_g1_i1:1391-2269(+)